MAVDLKPTQSMANNAKRGLELRKKHGKGGTSVGVARARDISNRKQMSPETVSRMVSFFARHDGNQSGGEDDAGYIAWLLWGGDSGKTWAESKKNALDKKKDKKSMLADKDAKSSCYIKGYTKKDGTEVKGYFLDKKSGRCWEGYEPVEGKKPYSDGSCRPE